MSDIKLVPYRAEHLMQINLQPGQSHSAPFVNAEHARALEHTQAFTILVGERPAGCGGVIEHWSGRFEAWSYIDADIGARAFLRGHLAVRRFFSSLNARRVEIYVDRVFPQGHRWARALGFDLEVSCLKKYFPDGRDASLYVLLDNKPIYTVTLPVKEYA